jgi:non-ribosomal peptide synthase protein (TIGR01720 family)
VGYSILRYLHPDATVRDSLRRLPPAPLLFNYLGQFDQTLPATGLFRILPELPFGGPLRGPRGRQSHLLEIIGRVTDGQLRLEWIYSDRVFAGPTIDALARWLGEALRDLIQHCLAAEAPRATPADFPLAKLGQQSLDQLMARLARK